MRMIKRIKFIGIPVSHQDRTLEFASPEKSSGHRYAPTGAGRSARAARELDVGWRGFSFSCW
jgi:hypothetical protein